MIGVFDHPWLSGLFGDDEAASLWSVETQIDRMLAFEAAWTRALGAVGKVDAQAADRTAAAILGFKPDIDDLAQGTAQDGVPVPALVRQIRGFAELPTMVHTGATSQDVMDTALALTLRDVSALVANRLEHLEAGLVRLDAAVGSCQMTGRTRMQAALPIRVSDRIRTWRLPLMDHGTRLLQVRPRVEIVQIGGAVGDGAAMGSDGEAITASVAATLGLAVPPASWHARRDGVADYAGCLSLISGTLGKMGQDICLMAQQGVDEIRLSGGGGSSAMPHKKNPVLAELLVTLARFNAVQLAGMHTALIHEQERSGAAWALEWMILPQMAMAASRGLAAAITLGGRIDAMGQLAGSGEG